MSTEMSRGSLLLYTLYQNSAPEKKQTVFLKLVELTNFPAFIELLNQNGFFRVKNTNQANQNIDFLIDLIKAYSLKKEKINCDQFFNLFFQLLEKKAEPSSYSKYSEFLKIIFSNITQENKKTIYDKLLNLDRVIAIYPMAHFGMVNSDYMTEICNIILSIVPKLVATKNIDVWNETMASIFSSNESSKLDKYTTYSAVDLALSTKSNLDQKFNLFYNAFKYFSQHEMTQLLRIHYATNIKQLTIKSSPNSICKALETGIEFSSLEAKPQTLLDLVKVFAKLYRSDPKINASYEHLIKSIPIDLIDATVLPLFEDDETAAAFYYFASCIQTKEILHHVVLPVKKELREFQYAAVTKLLKAKQIDVSLAAYMLSMLHTKDISLTSYILESSPSDFLSCTIRYLEGAVDYDKAVAISQLIQSVKKVPTVQSSGIDAAFGTVSTFFFSFGTEHNHLLKLLEYLIACHSSTEEFDFENAKVETWSDITKSVDKEWRSKLVDSALARIRRGENKQSIFLMAISDTSIALEQAIKALKGNTEALAALFTASIIAHQSDTIALVDLLLKGEAEEAKNRGIIGNLLGTGQKPQSVRRALIHAMQMVATYLEPTNGVIVCLLRLLKGAKEPDEITSMISIIPVILKSSIERGARGDFAPFFSQICSHEAEITENLLEEPLCALIQSSASIEQNLANDVAALWVRHVEKFKVEESKVEKTMLGGILMGFFAGALSQAYFNMKLSKYGFLSILRSVNAVPDAALFVPVVPILIGLSLKKFYSAKSIDLIKRICKIINVNMEVPDKKIAAELYLDAVLPFYTAIVESMGFAGSAKVALAIKFSSKPRGIFDYAIVKTFPGDVLKPGSLFTDFFTFCDDQNYVLMECLTRGVNHMTKYDAAVMLHRFLECVDRGPYHSVFKLLGRDPLIASAVLDYLDASVKKPMQPNFISNVTIAFDECIISGNLSSTDTRVQFAYLLLLSTGYISRLNITSTEQMLLCYRMKLIFNKLFPGAETPNIEYSTESVFAEAISAFGNQILMYRNDQIRSFLERASILKGTPHSFSYTCLLASMARTCGCSKLSDLISKPIYANAVNACASMNGKPAGEFSIVLSMVIEGSNGCLQSASQATTFEAFNLILKATQSAKAGAGQFELLVRLALQLPTTELSKQIQPIVAAAKRTTPKERLFTEDFFKLLIRFEGQKHDQHLLARDLPQMIEPMVAAIGLNEPMCAICSEYLKTVFKASTIEAALRSLCESTVATYKTPNYYANGVRRVTAALSHGSSRESQRIASAMTAILAGYPQHQANKEAVVESIVARGAQLNGAELEAFICDLFQ